MSRPLANACPYCDREMRPTRMACGRCGVAVEGAFSVPRLGRLPVEHQRFIELFVLSGGNLKALAGQVGVSYPTVRSRLDKVIAALRERIEAERSAGGVALGVRTVADADDPGDRPDDLDHAAGMTPAEAAALIKRI